MVYYIRTDHIGRPVFATNASGVKVWSATYLPFGGVHVSTGNLPSARFPGQWFQSESGLHQNWMRDYDPTTGRYLQADPLGLIDGASVYGYAGQSPMMNADPTGECFGPLIALAPACVGAVVSVAIGWLLDPDCYTWEEAFEDALWGAAGGAAFKGAGVAWNAWRNAGSRAAASTAARSATAAGFSPVKSGTGVVVDGFTTHGLQRAAGDGVKRAGTNWAAIKDALVNPRRVSAGVDQYGRPFQVFTGANARVVINPSTGKIVSVNPLGRAGVSGRGP